LNSEKVVCPRADEVVLAILRWNDENQEVKFQGRNPFMEKLSLKGEFTQKIINP
jgi:hypothetical protein